MREENQGGAGQAPAQSLFSPHSFPSYPILSYLILSYPVLIRQFHRMPEQSFLQLCRLPDKSPA